MAEALLCSLNEIRGLATKAARGAGLPWGVADEAGRAVGWLEARGLAGLAALDGAFDGALDGLAAPDWQRGFPVPEGAVWTARPGRSGPSGGIDGLLAGMTIADRAAGPAGPLPFCGAGALLLVRVRWPLLAVPFLAGVAGLRGERLALAAGSPPFGSPGSGPRESGIRESGAGGPAIAIGPRSVGAACRALEGLAVAEAVRIEGWRGAAAPDLPRLDGGIPIGKEVYARTDRWAARTLVPESAASRARGAGGGNPVETD